MNTQTQEYGDLPEFIIGITKDIWEDRNVSSLRDRYAPDIFVCSPSSIVRGNEAVINATMATLAEFPDRCLFGEDVIWSGDPESGYLSSHRLISTATHLGDGAYGKATGRRLTYRIIADCHVMAGKWCIDEEWIIRDHGAIVRQTGSTSQDFARDQIALEGGPGKAARPVPYEETHGTRYRGRGNDNSFGQQYAVILSEIMNGSFSVIPKEYDRACHLEYPGGFTGHSHGDADQFWMGIRSSFPDAEFHIEHQIGQNDEQMPPRAALRWSLVGTHSGFGRFGRPTGAPVHVMGLCHAEFGPWGLRREYVLIDEVSIWKQILIHSESE